MQESGAVEAEGNAADTAELKLPAGLKISPATPGMVRIQAGGNIKPDPNAKVGKHCNSCTGILLAVMVFYVIVERPKSSCFRLSRLGQSLNRCQVSLDRWWTARI